MSHLVSLRVVFAHMSVKLWWVSGALVSLRESDCLLWSTEQQEEVVLEECEDSQDYLELFGQLRSATGLLMSAAGEGLPEQAVTMLYQELHSVLVLQSEEFRRSEADAADVLQRLVLRLEALTPLTESIVKAAAGSSTAGGERVLCSDDMVLY